MRRRVWSRIAGNKGDGLMGELLDGQGIIRPLRTIRYII